MDGIPEAVSPDHLTADRDGSQHAEDARTQPRAPTSGECLEEMARSLGAWNAELDGFWTAMRQHGASGIHAKLVEAGYGAMMERRMAAAMEVAARAARVVMTRGKAKRRRRLTNAEFKLVKLAHACNVPVWACDARGALLSVNLPISTCGSRGSGFPTHADLRAWCRTNCASFYHLGRRVWRAAGSASDAGEGYFVPLTCQDDAELALARLTFG